MPAIAFLVAGRGEAANDNHLRLPRAFRAAGWRCASLIHDTLDLTPAGLSASDAAGVAHALAGFDAVWLLGFGPRASFLDRMQMLRTLDQSRFVNGVDAYVYLHGKCHFHLAEIEGAPDCQPETYASRDAGRLLEIVDGGGDWIAKPTAQSFGRGVFRIDANDVNRRVVLEHLTANGDTYCILQRFVPDAAAHEKRILTAAGRIVACYAKAPGVDHRGNLAAGGQPGATELSEVETERVERIGGYLADRGVLFAAIDLVFPYVLEVNVANPGGLATYESLTGTDASPGVVEAVAAALASRSPSSSHLSSRSSAS